jgi:hypothetical protein
VATWVNQALAALIAWWGSGAAVVVTAVAVWRTLRFFRRPAATFWYWLVTWNWELTCLEFFVEKYFLKVVIILLWENNCLFNLVLNNLEFCWSRII